MNNILKKILLFIVLTIVSVAAHAQQGFGTNTPAASSVVDMTATNKGVLLPRVTLTSVNDLITVPSPADNLLVFNTATSGTTANDVTPGFYYWNGTIWIRLLNKGDNLDTSWALTNNAGITNVTTTGTATVSGASLNLGVNNVANAGNIVLEDNNAGTTGNVTLIAPATVSGASKTITLPDATGTVALLSDLNGFNSLTAPAGSNVNGGFISSNALTLSYADGTYPGIVSTSTQTFKGAKMFTDAPTVSAFTSVGLVHNDATGLLSSSTIVDADVSTSAAISLTKLASGSNIATSLAVPTGSSATGGSIVSNVLTLSYTDGTNPGIVSTSTQTFKGAKTFTDAPTVSTFSTAGLTHNDASGLLFSSPIVTTDIADGTITNAKLATPVTNLGTGTTIVLRDNNGDFSAGKITATLLGNATTADNATKLATPRSVYGNSFDGSVDVTGVISPAYGGTGNQYTQFSGPSSSTKTFTLPNANATILTSNAAVTVAQGGTGLASIPSNNLMYGGASTVSLLAPHVTTGTILMNTASGAPSWSLLSGLPATAGVLPAANGGTGVANTGKTITLGGNLSISAAFSTNGANTITLTSAGGATNVTLPTSGLLYGTASGSIASSDLMASLNNETGTGLVVFGTSPTLTTPIINGTISGTTVIPVANGGTGLATYTAGNLLYASNSSTLAGLSTANNGILVTNSSGVPSIANTVGAALTMPSINLSASSNQLVLQSSGVKGTLTWTPTVSNKTITLPDATGTLALTNATVAGDVSGTLTTTSVDKLKGNSLSINTLTTNDLLKYNGSNWVNAAVSTLGTITLATGTTGTDINVLGSPASLGGTLTLNLPDASASARGLVTTGAQTIAGAKTFTQNVAVNGGDITTTSAAATLFNTAATTLNIGGAATTLTLGATTGSTTLRNNFISTGTATISGATLNLGTPGITTAGKIVLEDGAVGTYNISLSAPALVSGSSKTITLPDASGTVALVGAVVSCASGFTITTEETVIVNSGGGMGCYSVTLPNPTTCAGRKCTVKSAGNCISIYTPVGSIDAAASFGISAYDCVTFQSNGTNWWVINKYVH